jgi:hypothetical protein
VGNILKIRNAANNAWLTPNQWNFECFVQAAMTTQMDNLSINTTHTIEFDNPETDVGSDYDSATYTFTAPADGYYWFAAGVNMNDIGTVTGVKININTSNRSFQRYEGTQVWDTTNNYWPRLLVGIYWMDANDTATVSAYQQGGSATIEIYHGATSSYFFVARMTHP